MIAEDNAKYNPLSANGPTALTAEDIEPYLLTSSIIESENAAGVQFNMLRNVTLPQHPINHEYLNGEVRVEDLGDVASTITSAD